MLSNSKKYSSAKPAVWIVRLIFTLIVPASLFSQTSIVDTKHNLSVIGPGTIKASTETQICVFCHTPHDPQPVLPLWNHQLSTADYTLYSSDYLQKLNYDAPNQPNARSKLCLSCHDGTVALGAVYNNNKSTSIALENNVTTMPGSSSSNLGTSLTNDHPVGYGYDNTKDPELVARTWPWNTAIKLDPDASGGRVECHTCHEPHNNQHGNFLKMNNTNAALCNFCHQKTGWDQTIHKTSVQAFTPSGSSATTIGEWACRSCHTSHGGAGVPYLLNLSEENTCFNSGCHGNNQTGVNTKNIQSEYEKLYNHPTTSVSGKHKNGETSTYLSTSNRHAECQDCHNSHQEKKGLHALKTNAISEVLKGVPGIAPTSTMIWTPPTNFMQVTEATSEFQICMKCHSSYGFGQTVDGVSSIIGPSGQHITDQAMEFNPANRSAHPVNVALNDQTGSPSPKALTSLQMTTTWNSPGTQTMYCSDCHGNDQATSATAPQGPHGSNSQYMLTGQGKYWPTNASGELWSLADMQNGTNNWENDLFCANCHTMYSGGQFKNNAHSASNHLSADVKCITCHVAVPHGAKRSRLIGYESDIAPWNYNGVGTYEKLMITGFEKASGPNNYLKESCSTNNACHGTQIGTYED